MYCSGDISSLRATVSIHLGDPRFHQNSNRCFINHHLAGIVGPLGAVFFIAKARPKAKLMENLSQDMAPFNRRLNLPARLMPAFFTLVLVSQGPF